VPYQFAEYDGEFEPQASASRTGGPPQKRTGIGVLDPPFPPTRPSGHVPTPPTSLPYGIFAGLILAGLAAAILYLLFGVR
jgi:hypothetical protein